MAISSRQIGAALWSAVRDSAAILAAAQAIFGKAHAAYYAVGGTLSPPAADFPQIMVIPQERDISQQSDLDYSFVVGVILQTQDAEQGTTNTGVNYTYLKGFDYVEQLFELAFAEALGVSSNLKWNRGRIVFDPIGVEGQFSGKAVWSARVSRVIGAELEL